MADPTRVPGVGDRLYRRIPADSPQVVAVYGEDRDAAGSRAVLYTRRDAHWRAVGSWPARNGRNGWTTDHHEGDGRTPVGVFSLTDAGGVLADPGTRLPYDRNEVCVSRSGGPEPRPKPFRWPPALPMAASGSARRHQPFRRPPALPVAPSRSGCPPRQRSAG
ncbi:hypothetical protein ACF1GT_20280 [Streptomyces sp. NPDC014636]|uniref:hypothetical protein n=1 Tax=Streptomyces sp. NPDC014636 TaxID=3364876 RepID=UPI0037036946